MFTMPVPCALEALLVQLAGETPMHMSVYACALEFHYKACASHVYVIVVGSDTANDT